MADNIVISGVRRGRELLEIHEIKQMAGRGGRQQGSRYKVVVIAEPADLEYAKNGIESGGGPVISSMYEYEILGFHLLPEICAGRVRSKVEFDAWYERSLSAAQGRKASWDGVTEYLVKAGAMAFENGLAKATLVGEVSAKFYLYPEDLDAWSHNFTVLRNWELLNDDTALAWALGCVARMRAACYFGKSHGDIVGDCMNGLPSCLTPLDGCIPNMVLWRYVLGGPTVGKMRNAALNYREDASRVCASLACLFRSKPEWDGFFEDLSWRCANGVPGSIAELMRAGFAKNEALSLYNVGVSTIDQLREQWSQVSEDVSEAAMEKMRVMFQ